MIKKSCTMRKRTYSVNYDPVDEFMEKNSLYRKQLPRDGTCLFRAAAEQFLLTQSLHLELRTLCINYISLYKKEFQTLMDEDIERHLEKMRNPLSHGGLPELMAISQLFKCDYVIYTDLHLHQYMNHYKSKKPWLLYVDALHHFDLLYPKKYCNKAGFCQALVYEILYTNVLKMEDVVDVVDQMLHCTNTSYRTDSCTSNDMQEIMLMVDQTMKLNINQNSKTEENVVADHINSPPFPYRVAKALDPDIYRNIEYDAWKVLKREAKYGPYDKKGLQIGVKVHIKIDFSDDSIVFTEFRKIRDSTVPFVRDTLNGYIQAMTEDQGPVTVYVEEFGKIIKVPYNSLEKVAINNIYSPQDIKGYANPSPYKRLTHISYKNHLPNPPSSPKVNKSFEMPNAVSINESTVKKQQGNGEKISNPKESPPIDTKGDDIYVEADNMSNPYMPNNSLCMYGTYNEPLCMPIGSMGGNPVMYPNDSVMGPACYAYPPGYMCQPEGYPSWCNYPMYGSYQPYSYYVYYGSPYYNEFSPTNNCCPSYGDSALPEFSTEHFSGWDDAQYDLNEGQVMCKETKNGEFNSNINLEGHPLIKI